MSKRPRNQLQPPETAAHSPPGSAKAESPPPVGTQLKPLLVLLLVLAVVIGIRLRLLDLPLERDEGEYAYAGQLLLQGVPPYETLYSMKWPGTFAAYALLMALFGQTIAGIHFGLLLVTLANTALVFLISRRVSGVLPALVAAETFALLSITPYSFGLAAHATHFVLLPALCGILLLQNIDEQSKSTRILLTGVLFGLAALMKQAGAAFGLFAAAWILWQEIFPPGDAKRNWVRAAKRMFFLGVGGLLPLLLTGLILAVAGVFPRFWLWTVRYSGAYVGMNSFRTALHWLDYHGGRILMATQGLWVLATAGLVWLFWDPSLRPWRVFVLGFLIFSFLGVCPGGYFRGHYFLLLFPALGLLAGIFAQVGATLAKQQWPAWTANWVVLVFLAAAAWSLYSARDVFFFLSPNSASRKLYSLNPFPESVAIGHYLEAHCDPGATIAVMGSEPQLYFYSHRRSATGYIYTYPLTERHPYTKAMQDDMVREIISHRPQYIVFVSQLSSWATQPDSDPAMLEWFSEFQRDHLEPVALIDIFRDGHAEYCWSNPPNQRSDQWLRIYRSRDYIPLTNYPPPLR